jgi:hAT family C-terminal dimerisation region
MKIVSACSSIEEVPAEVKSRLFSENFIAKVREEIIIHSPVCNYIDCVQRDDCTLAESVESWMDVKIPLKFQQAKMNRDKQILDTPSLISNTLHPRFRGQKLNVSQQAEVENFLLRKLEAESFREFLNFKDKKGYFSSKLLSELPPDLFWKTIENYPRCEHLASIALLYTSLPSSTASLERIFSMWAYVHDKSRNRINRERSRKMLFVYHSLRKFTSTKEK